MSSSITVSTFLSTMPGQRNTDGLIHPSFVLKLSKRADSFNASTTAASLITKDSSTSEKFELAQFTGNL
jgi:hypothetical protein